MHDVIEPKAPDQAAVAIERQSHFNRCLHCRSCGSGCPFLEAMDHPPNNIIRMIQFGLVEEALSTGTIWACVGCYTCSMQCPMAIDIPALMDGLRQMALERGAPVAEPDVLAFHKAVLESVARYGRTHKLEIMMRYKWQTRTWLQDWQVGLKMMARRKLDLTPSRIRNPKDLAAWLRTDDNEVDHG